MRFLHSAWRAARLLLLFIPGLPVPSAMAQSAGPQPILDSLAALLLGGGADVVSRRARLAAADAEIAAAAPRDPAALRVEIENVPDGIAVDQAQLFAGIEAPILRGPAPGAARSAATRGRDLAALDLQLAERRATARLRRGIATWAAAVAGDRRLADADLMLGDAEESLRSRFAVGDARYVDVLRIRTARVNLGTDRSLLQSTAATALEEVIGLFVTDSSRAAAREMIGRLSPPEVLEFLAGATGSADSSLVDAWQVALGSRADAAVELSRARRGTTLQGFLGIQRFQNAAGDLVLGPAAGINLPLTFTAAGSTRSLVAEAEAQRAALLAEAAGRRTSLSAQVRQAVIRRDAALGRVRTIDGALLAGARAERDAALAIYRSGGLSLVEFIDFERALLLADVSRIEALRDAADAAAAIDQLPADELLTLDAAMGGH